MKKLFLSMILAISVPLMSFGSGWSVLADSNEDHDIIPFQMLSVNDFHGNINTESEYEKNGEMLNVGGAGYLATHLNQAEKDMQQQAKENGLKSHTVRLQAGDLVGGSPPISTMLQHEPTIKLFNKMNFKVNALGNHEFDQGMEEFRRLINARSVHPKVAEYTKGYDYNYEGVDDDSDFLAANVVDEETQEPIFDPYTVKNIDGVDVGFIGLDTTDTPRVVLKKHTEGYEFKDGAKTVNKYAKELQNKGVHAIVVVAHVAAYQDDGEITGNSADIAQNTIDEVDMIISGHSHTDVNGFVNGKLITQSRKYGEAYGDVRTELDPETDDFVKDFDNKKKVKVDAEIKPNTRDVDPDPEIQQIVNQTKEITDDVTNSAIGYAASGDPILEDHPQKEMPLGNLTTDAQRSMTGADFALNNSGSIRLNLIPETNNKGEHEITWGAAYQVQPFENTLGIYELTGKQIKDGINQQWQDGKGFLQLSGFKYTYVDGEKIPDCDGNYCIQDILLPDGSQMDMDETYTVAMNEFLGDGGDGFTILGEGEQVGQHDVDDTHTFINYIKKLNDEGKKIDPQIEGRAKLVEPSDNVKPVLKLEGNNPMELEVGETYEEPGATAKDDVDGDLTDDIVISGVDNINMEETGEYTITYKVSDKAGNAITKERTVKIIPSDQGKDDGDKDDKVESGIWHNDEGEPAADLGSENDLYLNTNNGDFYVKTTDGWQKEGTLTDGGKGSVGETDIIWYTHKGTPDTDLGDENDLYLNTDNNDVYQKTAKGWEKVDTLKAEQKEDEDEGTVSGSQDNDDGSNGTEGEGEKLPETATNLPLLALSGIVLITAGGSVLVFRRRRLSETDES